MMRNFFSWWLFIFFGILIFLLTLFLRLYHLDNFPVFVDEAIYVRWAQVMKAEQTLRFLPMSDGKQPLYMWMVIPFLSVIDNPLLAGRLVSSLTGLSTLVGIGFLSYLLFKSKKVVLTATFFYAIVPYAVFFDRLALADSMLSMFGIWTFIGGVLTARTLRLDIALLTGFVLGGAWLTKSPALFFTLLLPFTWPFADWRKKKLSLLLKLVFLTGVSFLISQGMFNILRLGPNFHLLSSRNMDYVYPINSILSSPLDPLIPHLKDIRLWFTTLGTVPLGFFLLAGVVVGVKRYRKEILLLSSLVVFPVIAQSVYAKVFTARYLYFVVPYVLIISALAWKTNSTRLKLALSFIFLWFVLSAGKQNFYLLTDPTKMSLPPGERSGYLEQWSAGQGIKEIATYLRERAIDLPDGKQIIVGTDGYFGTLPDGLQIHLNDLPQIKIFGAEVKFESVPKSVIDSFNAGNETYLVVNSSRFFIQNPENSGLKLIKSYPKAQKPNGERESLLFFELVS